MQILCYLHSVSRTVKGPKEANMTSCLDDIRGYRQTTGLERVT